MPALDGALVHLWILAALAEFPTFQGDTDQYTPCPWYYAISHGVSRLHGAV